MGFRYNTYVLSDIPLFEIAWIQRQIFLFQFTYRVWTISLIGRWAKIVGSGIGILWRLHYLYRASNPLIYLYTTLFRLFETYLPTVQFPKTCITNSIAYKINKPLFLKEFCFAFLGGLRKIRHLWIKAATNSISEMYRYSYVWRSQNIPFVSFLFYICSK